MEDKLRQFFSENFPGKVIKEDSFRGTISFYVAPEAILEICRVLHDNEELKVKMLSDITSVDWLGHDLEKEGRFEVVYNLYSIPNQYRFFIKVLLDGETPEIDSVTSVWAGADWMEREVFDLMGVIFKGHPDLKKIVTPDELEGYPLRKDFPLTYEVPQFNWNKDDPPEVIK